MTSVIEAVKATTQTEIEMDGFGFRLRKINSRLVMQRGSIMLAFVDIDELAKVAKKERKGDRKKTKEQKAEAEEDAKQQQTADLLRTIQGMTPAKSEDIIAHREAVVSAGVTHMQGSTGAWEAVAIRAGVRDPGDDEGLFVSDLQPAWFKRLYDSIIAISDDADEAGRKALAKFRAGEGDSPDA